MQQISIFNDIPVSNNKFFVLSASRMTDMPKYYPDEIINQVKNRLNKGVEIHTLVLWTKHPNALLERNLSYFIQELKGLDIQVYLQCTITGMGGTIIGRDRNGSPFAIEPNAPKPSEALKSLESVVVLLGNPLRIRLRIDPLIRIKSNVNKEKYSNLSHVEPIISFSSNIGIKNYSFSFLEKEVHKKVDKRFNELGWSIIPPSVEERTKTLQWMSSISSKYNVNISSCCVPGLPESRCIDGYLLEELHPQKKQSRKDEPRKRNLCGCTHSIDIGGWPPKKCFTGCQYCYANSSHS
ncbi:MAG: DUF1848 domain-containing protein [Clostridia bacterium]|nr:DUF1848 domain-containing protein [Clostridia bacterium]